MLVAKTFDVTIFINFLDYWPDCALDVLDKVQKLVYKFTGTTLQLLLMVSLTLVTLW